MKNLSDYVLPYSNINVKINYDKNKYTNKDIILQLNSGEILSDFYSFINYNNINNIDEDTYAFYLDSLYNNIYEYIDNPFTQDDYHKMYQIDESLYHSWDAHKLVEKINDIVKIKHVIYINPKREITQFEITLNNTKDINDTLNNDKFWSLIRLYNYYVKMISYNTIILEPYKPKDVTEKIYNDLHGIVYHITTKQKYVAGIRYKELAPKWKGEWDKLAHKPYNIWRDGRIFFIGNNNENIIKQQLLSIKNTSPGLINRECVVLKIDLNKYMKLKIRIDSSAQGYDAYFTEEPIPDFCITILNLDNWKEIKKETL